MLQTLIGLFMGLLKFCCPSPKRKEVNPDYLRSIWTRLRFSQPGPSNKQLRYVMEHYPALREQVYKEMMWLIEEYGWQVRPQENPANLRCIILFSDNDSHKFEAGKKLLEISRSAKNLRFLLHDGTDELKVVAAEIILDEQPSTKNAKLVLMAGIGEQSDRAADMLLNGSISFSILYRRQSRKILRLIMKYCTNRETQLAAARKLLDQAARASADDLYAICQLGDNNLGSQAWNKLTVISAAPHSIFRKILQCESLSYPAEEELLKRPSAEDLKVIIAYSKDGELQKKAALRLLYGEMHAEGFWSFLYWKKNREPTENDFRWIKQWEKNVPKEAELASHFIPDLGEESTTKVMRELKKAC